MDTLRQEGVVAQSEGGQILLVDGTPADVPGTVTVSLRVQSARVTHTFTIVPEMESDLLLGVDLQAKLRLGVPPPPLFALPDRGQCWAARGLTDQTPEERQALAEFLDRELRQFEGICGPTGKTQHRIRLRDPTPIKQRYRPRNPAMQAIINKEVEEMLGQGIIEPSGSPWSSPIVVVRKKDGNHRFCIDFRRVNDVTHRDAYPLPQVTATLDKLRGARYLSTLDLKNGYWQVPLTPESRPITAFTVPGKGLFHFRVMPFGLHSAPATFQRLLDTVLGPDLEPHVFVYLDDIIVISRTFSEHLELLAETFRRLREARLRLNPEKCKFCVDQLKYLGHVVGRDGIETDPEKVSAVADWPEPTTIKQIRQFLGMASWYRRFIANFSTLAAPLTQLTRKNARWKWGEEEATAFRALKEQLISAPVLACPDFTRRFILQTDASSTGLGVVLTQRYEEGDRVIAYASRTLHAAERNYSATELECLAVIWGIRRMRNYLEGYAFTVVTDHQALKWMRKLESPTGRLGRWSLELQQYEFDIQYRRGVLNRVADALSRQPTNCAARTGHCKWYRKILKEVREEPENRPEYQIREGRLYRHILHSLNFKETSPEQQWKLCIPEPLRQRTMEKFHDAPTAGHLGIAKTIARIAERYYWPGMFRDIGKYVRACTNCQSHKAAQQRPAGTLHATNITRPWEQATIDLVGPLPRSRKGHTWLLSMQDRFTKWAEFVPLRRATAEAVTKAITDQLVLRHGKPDTILTDNGTQLRSRRLEERLAALNIRHLTTPAYAPHCNPVERTNRTIKTMIGQYVDKDHRSWDEQLAALQFAYNTAIHDATGYTPAYLLHGRELTPPTEIDTPPTTGNTPDTVRKNLEEAYELVRVNLAQAFQRQEKYYNLRRREWKPALREWVWKKEHPLSNKANAFNAKLAPKYSGPYEVRNIISPVIVDLRSKRGKWIRHVHVQDLKPSFQNKNTPGDDDPIPTNGNDDSE